MDYGCILVFIMQTDCAKVLGATDWLTNFYTYLFMIYAELNI